MTDELLFLDVDSLRDDFTWLVFERINPEKNEHRYYAIGWQPTLYHAGAIVRVYGRIGRPKRLMAPIPFDSLDEAWPTIAKMIRRRLKRGYRLADDVQIFEPILRISFGPPSKIVPMEQLPLYETID